MGFVFHENVPYDRICCGSQISRFPLLFALMLFGCGAFLTNKGFEWRKKKFLNFLAR